MTISAPVLPKDERIVLEAVSWQFYETLLREINDNRTLRIAYDRGRVELMSPSMPHERSKRLLEKLIDALLEELEQPAVSVGSMTCKRQDLARGVEPDTGYYIQNERSVRALSSIDLTQAPAPDLIVEVEYSSSAINKLDLYAALGVPELWRYDGQRLRIFQLQTGEYEMVQQSLAFPNLAILDLPKFMQLAKQEGEIVMIKQFRRWVQQQQP